MQKAKNMASLTKETRNGKSRYRLSFYDKDNRRRFIRLGSSQKSADTTRVHVDELVDAAIAGRPVTRATELWLQKIGAKLHEKLKLAAVGLVASRGWGHTGRDGLSWGRGQREGGFRSTWGATPSQKCRFRRV